MDRSRVAILIALLLFPFGGLQARLVQMQIVEPETFVGNLSARTSIEVIKPMDGKIVDRKNRVLAEDCRSFDCYLILEEYEKGPPEPLAELLARPAPGHAGMTPDEFREKIEEIYGRIEKQIRRRPREEWRRLYLRERRTPHLFRRDIPSDAAIAIETCPQLYAGAVIRESLKRRYPYGPAACHIVGYLGRLRIDKERNELQDLVERGFFGEGYDDVLGEEGLLRRGEFQDLSIGRSGVEKSYNDVLRGRPGLAILEREPGTGRKTLNEIRPAEPGMDLELTIDIDVQKAVEDGISGPRLIGAAVLEPRTGAVLALASSRRFDPNHFVAQGNPAATEEVKRVLADEEGKPLLSLAFQQQGALGSIFKVLTSVAGMEEGKVKANDRLPCRGRFVENSRYFACWIWNRFQGMHGEITVHEALERSCNCYFYELGRRLQVAGIAKWALAMGYGKPTGVDLPGEARGIVPQHQRHLNDELSLSIGQHELMVSPLQAAVMMAAIANGGYRVRPHVNRAAAQNPEFAPKPLGLSAETIREIRKGLYEVVHGLQGTAHNTNLKAYGAAGKTSSAQAGKDRDSHAWFAGYAPHDAPKYVLCVFVAYGGHGGEAAAPVAAAIFDLLFKADKAVGAAK